jgi:hypothetical protein
MLRSGWALRAIRIDNPALQMKESMQMVVTSSLVAEDLAASTDDAAWAWRNA